MGELTNVDHQDQLLPSWRFGSGFMHNAWVTSLQRSAVLLTAAVISTLKGGDLNEFYCFRTHRLHLICFASCHLKAIDPYLSCRLLPFGFRPVNAFCDQTVSEAKQAPLTFSTFNVPSVGDDMLVSLTVGKVDAGVAVLLTEDKRLVGRPYSLIECAIHSVSLEALKRIFRHKM